VGGGRALRKSNLEHTFFDRWLRRGMIATFGVGFTLPYFRLLNRVHVEGDELLTELPHAGVVFLANHQTYFMEAIAFFDLVYVRVGLPLERPMLRFSAAEETMSKNAFLKLFARLGGITFKRSFREGGRDVSRPVDLEGVSRVEEAIRGGWLLHFPAGTTQKGAPLRAGIAQILHRTNAIAVPVRVDGFRDLLLHKQLPGKLFKKCSITIHPPMDLKGFYAAPYQKEAGRELVTRLGALINDPRAEGA
jgi:1-acyl-sn-glycerol-3-phosphate acyltransferase